MKRFVTILMILCLLLTCALADGECVCPNCGLTMTRKSCTKCRAPSPAPVPAEECAPTPAPTSASSVPKGGIDAMVSVNRTSLMKGDLTELIGILKSGDVVYAVNSKRDSEGFEWVQVLVEANEQVGYVTIDALALGATPTPKAKLWKGDPTQVGNIVTFGRYEQDADESNDKEPIEWIVISYDASKKQAKLLSKYGLEVKAYHHEHPYPTWEKSDIRAWLNGDFLQAAFTAEEQACIVKTEVKTNDNSAWKPIAEAEGWTSYEKVSGGNSCEDKIFLLSLEEAMEYGGYSTALEFYKSRKTALQAKQTQHAIDNGAYKADDGCCWWWLRSPGYYSKYASYVGSGGSLGNYDVYDAGSVARPAFILNLGSE